MQVGGGIRSPHEAAGMAGNNQFQRITVEEPMAPVNPSGFPLPEHEFDIRVRYYETDAQGHVHHTTYINYFEIARVEMLRAAGYSYRALEDDGMMLVVTEVNCQFFAPARYDDLLTVKTRVARARGVRIRHVYEITRNGETMATGWTVVAAIGKDGKVKRLPKWLRVARADLGRGVEDAAG